MFALNVQANLNDKERTNKFIMSLQVVLSSSIDDKDKILALVYCNLWNDCCYPVAVSINNECNERFWMRLNEWVAGVVLVITKRSVILYEKKNRQISMKMPINRMGECILSMDWKNCECFVGRQSSECKLVRFTIVH